eukprot:469654-Rhodomonas_salina.3
MLMHPHVCRRRSSELTKQSAWVSDERLRLGIWGDSEPANVFEWLPVTLPPAASFERDRSTVFATRGIEKGSEHDITRRTARGSTRWHAKLRERSCVEVAGARRQPTVPSQGPRARSEPGERGPQNWDDRGVCSGAPTSVHYQILTADVGNVKNPQRKILGARIQVSLAVSFGCLSVSVWRAGGLAGWRAACLLSLIHISEPTRPRLI